MVRAAVRRVLCVATDVRDANACETLTAAAAGGLGLIDTLLNNAGGSRATDLDSWTARTSTT